MDEPEHFSAALTALEARGALLVNHKTLIITNPETLRASASAERSQ